MKKWNKLITRKNNKKKYWKLMFLRTKNNLNVQIFIILVAHLIIRPNPSFK